MPSHNSLPRRRLIVNADDFGRSEAINQAVMKAHQTGLLTTASLMVNEPAAEQAIALAREHPRLGVGLHVTLVCGHSALPHERIPDLVRPEGTFSADAVRSGWRFFWDRNLKPQLEAELEAQFARFRASGLELDHVNGHLNMHLHPVVFALLMQHARDWGIRRFRLTRDPLWLNLRLARGRWLYRLSHALIFGVLSRRARPALQARGIKHTQAVFGLLQNAAVDRAYVEQLLRVLPPGDWELYSHPTLDHPRHEYEALSDPRLKALARELGIELIRYQDL